MASTSAATRFDASGGGGRSPHRHAGNEEEEAERVAGRARLARKSDEAESRPRCRSASPCRSRPRRHAPRKPKIDAVNCSGTVNARMQRATCLPSVGSTQPSWSPDVTNVAAASPKKPSASGPAIGRRVTSVRRRRARHEPSSRRASRSSHDERLRRAGLDPGREPLRLRSRTRTGTPSRAQQFLSRSAFAACAAIVQVMATSCVRR